MSLRVCGFVSLAILATASAATGCTGERQPADGSADVAIESGFDAAIDTAPVDSSSIDVSIDRNRGPSDSGYAVAHRFLAVDNNRLRLIMVDQIHGNEWEQSVPFDPRDLQLLDGDRVLMSHSAGAIEYALADGTPGWSVRGFTGVESARRLPNGHTILGANSPSGVLLIDVDAAGHETSRRTLPGLAELRLIRVLPNGNVLLTVSGPYRVLEIDDGGRTVWSADLPGKGYLAERLADGSTLATTGDDVRLVQFDPSGTIVSQIGGRTDFADAGFNWFSGFELRDGGTAVIANWLGHGALGTGPHVVEIDPSNHLVWSWTDFARADTVTNVLVIE